MSSHPPTMTENAGRPTAPPPARGSAPASVAEPSAAPVNSKARQYISFSFYKLMAEFRRLDKKLQQQYLHDLVELVKTNDPSKMLLLVYSCIGTRPDVDIMFWKISYDLDQLQHFSAAINRLPIGGYLTQPFSYLAQSKRSTYVDKIDPAHDDTRTTIVPGNRKYNFVYPFVKTRDWYLLSKQTRQGVMDEHIMVGNKYPSVKLNTTYSFGIDDQEFVVAFETDQPSDFLDLVQELRETEGSRFTLRDTPIFTCVQTPIELLVKDLADV
jgi:chlorite dismutase